MAGSRVLDHSPDLVLLTDRSGKVRHANAVAARALGQQRSSLVGASIFDLLHPDDRAYALGALASALEPGDRTPALEVRVHCANGDYRRCEAVAVHVQAGELDADATLFVQLRDLSVARRVVQPEALVTERLQAMVNASNELTLLLDAEHTVIYSSAASEQVLGFRPDLLAGRAIAELLAPGDHHTFQVCLDEVSSEPAREVRAEVRLVASTGESRLFETYLVNLLDDPSVGGIILTGRDITTFRRTQHLLDETRQLLFSVPFAVALLDGRGALLRANDAWRNFTGTEASEHGSSLLLDVLHPDDAADVADLLQGRIDTPVEVRCMRPDDTVTTVRLQLSTFHDFDGNPYTLALLEPVRDLTGESSDDERATAQLALRATHDPLTRLPNRQLFDQRLRAALTLADRRRSLLAVLFCDLDGFKGINDSLGHQAGDIVLAAVADRLRNCVRPTDAVARLGGDEFVVIAEELSSAGAAAAVAERLLGAVRDPIVVNDRKVTVGMSIGIALTDRWIPPDRLLASADKAMYRAKKSGRRRYHLSRATR